MEHIKNELPDTINYDLSQTWYDGRFLKKGTMKHILSNCNLTLNRYGDTTKY